MGVVLPLVLTADQNNDCQITYRRLAMGTYRCGRPRISKRRCEALSAQEITVTIQRLNASHANAAAATLGEAWDARAVPVTRSKRCGSAAEDGVI